ncbi:hypothetical protein Hanom_Chr00s066794g01787381 [Helianthus anomalus]
MKTAESEIRRNPGVCDPFTKRTVKIRSGLQLTRRRSFPSLASLKKGILRNLRFWAYDPKMAEAVIVSEEKSIRIPNSYDLMSFQEEDILVLSNQQIRCHEKYEVCAKEWTTAAANIL